MNKVIQTNKELENIYQTTLSSPKKLIRKRKRSAVIPSTKRCSICLDPCLYIDSQLLECVKCKGPFHSMCIPGIGKDWECDKCKYLTMKSQQSESIR
jgi:hypothetical protein